MSHRVVALLPEVTRRPRLLVSSNTGARRRRDVPNRAGVPAGPGMLAASVLTIVIAQL